VYDGDPEAVTQTFAEILFRHLVADLPPGFLDHSYGIKSGKNLATDLFERRALQELVRSAEGVARDIIYIFSAAFFTAKRRGQEIIQKDCVLQEARQWFEQDKYQGLSQLHKAAFERLTSYLIVKKRSRTFLVPAEEESHPLLQDLLDARVLHLMRRGYFDAESTGVRYSIFNLDYGSYLHVANDPKYSNELEERKLRPTSGTKYINPFGDHRSIRRVLLPREILA
jgi:hypothetical protein